MSDVRQITEAVQPRLAQLRPGTAADAPRPATRRASLCRLAGLGLLPLLVAGCAGGLIPKPPAPPARFTLDGGDAGGPAPVTPAPDAPSLLVAVPRAAPGFDSPRMVYLQRPQELQAFAFHEWVDTPAQMLAPLMQRALQASGAFGAVLGASSTALTRWRLETEIVRLHQDFGSRPSGVRLTLRAVLVDVAARRAVAWGEFDEVVAATGDDPVAGAAAAMLATQRVLAALTTFCAKQVR